MGHVNLNGENVELRGKFSVATRLAAVGLDGGDWERECANVNPPESGSSRSLSEKIWEFRRPVCESVSAIRQPVQTAE